MVDRFYDASASRRIRVRVATSGHAASGRRRHDGLREQVLLDWDVVRPHGWLVALHLFNIYEK